MIGCIFQISGASRTYQSNDYQSQTGYTGPNSNLRDIRMMIGQNRLVEAEELLDGIPLIRIKYHHMPS